MFLEQYEVVFKSIFSELEKYSWNIECVAFVMDLLHIHLKELLEAIAFAHVQQQQQYCQQLQSLQHQQLQIQKQIQQQEASAAAAAVNACKPSNANGTFSPPGGKANLLPGNTANNLGSSSAVLISGHQAPFSLASIASTNAASQPGQAPNSLNHHQHMHLHSISSTLNNHMQQQQQSNQLIIKLQELITTLIQVSVLGLFGFVLITFTTGSLKTVKC